MRTSLKILLATGSLLAIPVAMVALEGRPFSIQLKTSANGIVASCASGCAWTTLSAAYPGGTYRITEQGITPVTGRERAGAPEFSFVLSATERGFAAKCEAGCAWNSLSATDPRGTFQMTDTGVRTGRAVE